MRSTDRTSIFGSVPSQCTRHGVRFGRLGPQRFDAFIAWVVGVSNEPRQLLMLTIMPSSRSSHAGLSVMVKRSAINRLAIVRGLMATMTNQAPRTSRFDTGRRASRQALSARDKVRQIGSPIGSLTDASLAA